MTRKGWDFPPDKSQNKNHDPSEHTIRATAHHSEPLASAANLDKLVNTMVLWNLEVVLLRNGRGDETSSKSVVGGIFLSGTKGSYEPSSDEVTALEVLD